MILEWRQEAKEKKQYSQEACIYNQFYNSFSVAMYLTPVFLYEISNKIRN